MSCQSVVWVVTVRDYLVNDGPAAAVGESFSLSCPGGCVQVRRNVGNGIKPIRVSVALST